ncbi:hypothetical protein L9F63_011740, partial [Diploptera punctata]
FHGRSCYDELEEDFRAVGRGWVECLNALDKIYSRGNRSYQRIQLEEQENRCNIARRRRVFIRK